MQNPIRFFNSISASDINEVGGKGANLGELTRAGFDVPQGFCVTTSAYSAFIKPQENHVYALLENLKIDDLESVRNAGQKVRDLLSKLDLPVELVELLLEAWQETGEKNAYAVRSSATAEDLPQASFAGQQDTYLNIIGRENLLNAVKDCFISLFTDRAILYRIQNNFAHADVQLSVVVQLMVIPDASGIMFTADPINGNRNIISIDASFGIGEALVSGLVSADLYQVRKPDGTQQPDGAIVKKQIGDKDIAIVAEKNGGTKTIQLSAEQKEKSALTDAQIIELAHLGQSIEAHYGVPQDIEWVLADGGFQITQSRPITSLFPLPEETIDPDKLYLSFNHFQVMTDAMAPLSMSLFRSIITIGQDKNTLETKYLVPVGGRLYIEASEILAHPKLGKTFPEMVDRADHLTGEMINDWVSKKPKRSQKSRISLIKLLPVALPILWRVRSCLLSKKYQNFPEKMSEYMDRYEAQVQNEISNTDDLDLKLEVCRKELANLFETIKPWRAHLIASMIAMKLLHVLMKNRVDSSVQDALMRGLEGNVTTEMDLAVGDLADIARPSIELTACLSEPDVSYEQKLSLAEDLPNGKEFIASWNEFIRKYGARGPSEIDLYRPRWREDASSLMSMVAGMLKSGETGAHREHYQQLITANEAANNTIIAKAGGGFWGFVRKPLARRMAYVIRELFPLREHHKFLIVRVLDLTKKVIAQAGIQLQSEKKIANADDVWFLSLPELRQVLTGETDVTAFPIEQRKQDFDHYKSMTPPRVITGEGEVLSASHDNANAPEGSLVGSPVSAGIVEGRARVILDPSKEILHPGEILIAPFTDPGWTPLFVNAGGLVTEVGGLMTHGSVIAREYGIPAVVGVVNATKIIKTGQQVRVHGEAGFVEILQEAPDEASNEVSDKKMDIRP